MKKMRRIPGFVILALGGMALTGWLAPLARAGDDPDPKAIARAHAFLKTAGRGRDILSYVHCATAYQSHSYKKTLPVMNGAKQVPGHFGLVYNFQWGEDGSTDLGFLCDAKGSVYKVQVLWTNAEVNQPFVVGNLSIKVVGNLLIKALGNQMTPEERKDVQKLVDDADARGILEWSLKFQQALGG